MLFNSIQYLIFLPTVVLLYWILPKGLRPAILLVASYIFYASWNPYYLILIVSLTVFNWLIGFAIDWGKSKSTKKLFLWLAILIDVGALGYFKYSNFFLQIGYDTMNSFGIPHPEIVVEVILPLGISFFTFEFLHYILDIYKGSAPVKNFIHFALLPGFFPSQIAGPIKRYQDFVPQMENPADFEMDNFEKGFVMVLHGIAKKVLLADNLSVFVDLVYNKPELFTTVDLWLATYAFAFQVYCDFSGYTDVAIGSALMMNIKIPPNFNVPFMSNNIRELWHRQHISLSFWFRDYVYIPLGGSRCPPYRIYFNLIATTALAGLWHGAAWHFCAWGAFQGGCLIIHREWMRFYRNIDWLAEFIKSKYWHACAIFITFQAFTLSFVYFRADTMGAANLIMGKMLQVWNIPSEGTPHFLSSKLPLVVPLVPFILAGLMVAHILSEYLRDIKFWSTRPRWLQAAYCSILIVLMLALMPEKANKFLYFQF
ncbi:MAG: MBOAT family O-acyltransferase [Cyanobacteriota/Melainabacteria group bacterium]